MRCWSATQVSRWTGGHRSRISSRLKAAVDGLRSHFDRKRRPGKDQRSPRSATISAAIDPGILESRLRTSSRPGPELRAPCHSIVVLSGAWFSGSGSQPSDIQSATAAPDSLRPLHRPTAATTSCSSSRWPIISSHSRASSNILTMRAPPVFHGTERTFPEIRWQKGWLRSMRLLYAVKIREAKTEIPHKKRRLMAITIKPGSAKVHVTAHPHLHPPAVKGTSMSYTGTPIKAIGEVTLLGSAGDNPAGWQLGFIQLQWIETNWCYYRGHTVNDGSIFIQRAR